MILIHTPSRVRIFEFRKAIAIIVMFLSSFAVIAPSVIDAGCGCGSPPGATSCGSIGSTCYNVSPNPICGEGGGNNSWCQSTCNFNPGVGAVICGSGGGGGCSESNPGSVSLGAPTNGEVLQTNRTTLSWRNNGGWGEGCSTRKRNTVYIRANCTGGWSRVGGQSERSSQGASNLEWDTTYCWYVNRSNGGKSKNSATWRFTTPEPPILENSGFIASTISQCTTSASSGRVKQNSSDPATNNPIIYTAEFSYAGGVSEFQELRLAFIPISITSDSSRRFNLLDNRLRDYPAFRVMDLQGTPTFTSVDSSSNPYFGSSASVGNLTNSAGTATLLELNGSETFVQIVDGNTIKVSWKVRFEDNLESNEYGVYVSGVALSPDGTTLFSNGAQRITSSGAHLQYVRTDDWIIDMNPPLAQASSPVVTGVDTLQITWIATDSGIGNTGLEEVLSYCYISGGENSSIKDLDSVLGGTIDLGSSPLKFPDISNCLVDQSNLGLRKYKIPLDINGDIVFKISAQDSACNITEATAVQPQPSPWVISKDSSASAQQGYRKLKPREVDLEGLFQDAAKNDSYLSEYGVYSGNGDLPSGRSSKNRFVARGYLDEGVSPPDIANTTSWYRFMEDLLDSRANVQEVTAFNIRGSINAALVSAGVNTSDARTVVKVNTLGGIGNFIIGNSSPLGKIKAICDLDVIVLVEGNLVIRPHLDSSEGGCVFIVSGDVIVESGYNSNPSSRPLTASSLYDEIHALIVTDGVFTTNIDTASGASADGLYINGGVTANQFSLNRTLGLTHNPSQPAEVFDYDPYYLEVFRDLLAVTKFSLRED